MTLHIFKGSEPALTTEPFISGELELEIVALDSLIVAQFRRVLFVARTPPGVAPEEADSQAQPALVQPLAGADRLAQEIVGFPQIFSRHGITTRF